LNRGVAVSFTVKLEVSAQVYILAIFTTFFVSPGDAPGTITLNIVWMEREFDAYNVSPGDAPATITQYLHGWKDNSMLAKPLAACTYLSSIVSELYHA